jgi:hypothetical protein
MHSLVWPWPTLVKGWAKHGQGFPWVGLEIGSAVMGSPSYVPCCPCSDLAMGWAGHELDWLLPGLAMGWARNGLG